MKHKRHGRTLGRNRDQRASLFKTLSSDLLLHGSVVTTLAKGKELQRYIEPLITRAKGGLTLHNRRQLQRHVRSPKDLPRLVALAEAARKRAGGYTRVTRLPRTRTDNAQEVRVALVDFNKI